MTDTPYPFLNDGLIATEASLTLESIIDSIDEWLSAVLDYVRRMIKIIELIDKTNVYEANSYNRS